MVKTYNVGDLRKLVTESSEFKPKIGDGVESENKKNNGKAYKDAKTRANDYDGGLKADEKKPKYVLGDTAVTVSQNQTAIRQHWIIIQKMFLKNGRIGFMPKQKDILPLLK